MKHKDEIDLMKQTIYAQEEQVIPLN